MRQAELRFGVFPPTKTDIIALSPGGHFQRASDQPLGEYSTISFHLRDKVVRALSVTPALSCLVVGPAAEQCAYAYIG